MRPVFTREQLDAALAAAGPWDGDAAPKLCITATITDDELGTLLEVRLADGRLVYGIDPARPDVPD